MHKQTQAYLLTLLAVLFWSTAASAFKLALRTTSPQMVLCYTTALSTLVLFLILVLRGKLRAIGNMSIAAIARCVLLGVLNPFLYYLVLFKAYALLPGQIAMALNYGWPLVLTVLSVPLLGQSLSSKQIIAILISFFGAVMIATQGQMIHFGQLNVQGVSLAVISTLIWALFWLLNAKDGQDPIMKLFISFCSGLLCILVYCSLSAAFILPDRHAWIPLVYIALFEMSLTFILWLTALQRTTSTAKIGNLMYLTPFLSLLCLHLVVRETIHQATFWGLSLIIGSIVYQAKPGKRAK
ncbi:DMT family transporter [Desulfobulbus rhabdoformis]|jgi:drug/metabolite transporter (DMT)-like permease|uniref:DMT family transporter n=1 Tax=Desulfobulbus rhabdoformis TaxID=34032 RepID=UPI0019642EEC|nr:DMT family transporter [Desulfobulbus rhabdoformis]MBM9613191.1 DMT family transporter [Desulfobulbus rhabdoformis]